MGRVGEMFGGTVGCCAEARGARRSLRNVVSLAWISPVAPAVFCDPPVKRNAIQFRRSEAGLAWRVHGYSRNALLYW